MILGVPLLPTPPTITPLWAPFFLLLKDTLSTRIFHEKLFGSVLPALQDEPDVLPGFSAIACFYDDLVGCSGEGGRGSAEGSSVRTGVQWPLSPGLTFDLRPQPGRGEQVQILTVQALEIECALNWGPVVCSHFIYYSSLFAWRTW